MKEKQRPSTFNVEACWIIGLLSFRKPQLLIALRIAGLELGLRPIRRSRPRNICLNLRDKRTHCEQTVRWPFDPKRFSRCRQYKTTVSSAGHSGTPARTGNSIRVRLIAASRAPTIITKSFSLRVRGEPIRRTVFFPKINKIWLHLHHSSGCAFDEIVRRELAAVLVKIVA
jgi:hypothetical protein